MCNKSDNLEWREYISSHCCILETWNNKTHIGTLYRLAGLQKRAGHGAVGEAGDGLLDEHARNCAHDQAAWHACEQMSPTLPPRCPWLLCSLTLSAESVSHSKQTRRPAPTHGQRSPGLGEARRRRRCHGCPRQV